MIALAHVDQLGAGTVPCEPDAGRGDTGQCDCVRARADARGDEETGKAGLHGVRSVTAPAIPASVSRARKARVVRVRASEVVGIRFAVLATSSGGGKVCDLRFRGVWRLCGLPSWRRGG